MESITESKKVLKKRLIRYDWSSYAVAEWLNEMMSRHDLTVSELYKKLKRFEGCKRKHLYNLLRAFTNLHPDILKAWEEKHPSTTVFNIFRLSVLDKDEQLDMWNILIGKIPRESYSKQVATSVGEQG